jgi:diguanylate cyclase
MAPCSGVCSHCSFWCIPHVVYWRAARAKDPKKAELTNMLIDPALFGLWMAALRFPLLITFLLFITALVNNAVNSGFKGLVQCQAAIACGILISVACLWLAGIT